MIFRFAKTILMIFLVGVPFARAETIRVSKAGGLEAAVENVRDVLSRLPQKSLVLIGENHDDEAGRFLVAEIVARLDAGMRQKCYYLEASPVYQPALDLVGVTLERAQDEHERIFADEALLFKKYLNEDRSPWIDFGHISEFAARGYQLFAVDQEFNELALRKEFQLKEKALAADATVEDRAKYMHAILHLRNEQMAQVINASFSSAGCGFGVLVVGKQHLFVRRPHPTVPTLPLQDFLQPDFATINVAECRTADACTKYVSDADLNILIDP